MYIYISVYFVTGKSYANYCPGSWNLREVSYNEWVKTSFVKYFTFLDLFNKIIDTLVYEKN